MTPPVVKSDESSTSQNKKDSAYQQYASSNQTSLTDELKERIHKRLDKHRDTLIELAKR